MALAVVDANLLISAFDRSNETHSIARSWLEAVLAGSDVLAVPMLAIAALLRTSTHHSLDHLPERLEDALGFVDDLIALPNVRVLHTDRAHWTELKRVLDETGVMGRSITDAQFAALTLQHDGIFYTTDRHFRRFPRLRCVNPLTAGR